MSNPSDDELLGRLTELADDDVPFSTRTMRDAPEDAEAILRGEAE